MTRFEKIKEYSKDVALGAKNFHFFRMTQVPRIARVMSDMEKKVLAAALTVLVVSAAFLITDSYYTVTESAPDLGGRFIEGLVGQPRLINPALSPANNVDADVARVVYSGLYKFNSDRAFVPDLASALPEISPDQKQYTIHLREDVLWHDGQKFTSDDVIFTIKLIQNPIYSSPLRLNWNKIELQKLDDYTLVISLNEASAPFATNLTLGVLPKHIWENVDPANFALSRFNLEAIGTGPFMIKDIVKSDEGDIKSITLSAFSQYQPRRAFLDEVVFKFYETYDGMIAAYHSRDIMGLGYIPFDKKVYIEKSSRIILNKLNMPQYQALFLNNNKSAVLNDKNVRAALTQSLDRDRIISEIYQGAASPSLGPIPPGYLGYNSGLTDAHKFNLENSEKLLAESGFVEQEGSDVLRKGDVELEFSISTSNFPLNEQVANALKKQWEGIGFRINVQVLTIGELEQNYIRPREYQSLLFSENVGADPDPYPFWHSSQRVDPGLNLALLNNKEVDNLLTEARSVADPEYRRPRYERFQELIVDEIPAVFIVSPSFVYGLNEKLRGFEVNNVSRPSDRFTDIGLWYINTKRSVKSE